MSGCSTEKATPDARYADPEDGADVVDDRSSLVREEDDDDVQQSDQRDRTKKSEEDGLFSSVEGREHDDSGERSGGERDAEVLRLADVSSRALSRGGRDARCRQHARPEGS